MGRLAAVGTGMLLALAGCARPGTQPVLQSPSPTASAVFTACVYTPPPSPSPSRKLRPDPVASSRRPARPSTNPSVNRSRSPTVDDEWAARVAENNAFRQRHALQPAVLTASKPYAQAVCTGLKRLRDTTRYGANDIRQVLTSAGLDEVQARPRGGYDLGGGDGLLFAGWTGHACVFGAHGRTYTDVEVGSQIADGGCLPAPS